MNREKMRHAMRILTSWIVLAVPLAFAGDPQGLLQQLNAYPHSEQIAFEQRQVLDHEIGLGAMQKVRGVWRFKDSERLSGLLSSYTWQIVDGFASIEVMDELVSSLDEDQAAQLLFKCQGRSCGHGSQWANRVFGQRVLYGREDMQRYRVYALEQGAQYRLVIYSAARTADRQYLHVDLLRIDAGE